MLNSTPAGMAAAGLCRQLWVRSVVDAVLKLQRGQFCE